MEFEPLSTEKICSLSKKLGRNRSVGADDIPAEVYKYGSPRVRATNVDTYTKVDSTKVSPSFVTEH